jgi:predicted DNA-binding protein (MmcQ/YjbR family)
MFAMVGGHGGLSFKVSDIAYAVLTESGRAVPAPYLARAKWVHLSNPADWDPVELAEHLASAYGIVAGKLTRKARAELGLA